MARMNYKEMLALIKEDLKCPQCQVDIEIVNISDEYFTNKKKQNVYYYKLKCICHNCKAIMDLQLRRKKLNMISFKSKVEDAELNSWTSQEVYWEDKYDCEAKRLETAMSRLDYEFTTPTPDLD